MPASGPLVPPVPGGRKRPAPRATAGRLRPGGAARGTRRRRRRCSTSDAGGVRAGSALFAQLQPGPPRGRRARRGQSRPGTYAADRIRCEVAPCCAGSSGAGFRRHLWSNEFAIVLPETDQSGARQSVIRVRERLAAVPLEGDPRLERNRFSAGIVTYPHPAAFQADDLFAMAEAALMRGRAQLGERIGVACRGKAGRRGSGEVHAVRNCPLCTLTRLARGPAYAAYPLTCLPAPRFPLTVFRSHVVGSSAIWFSPRISKCR